MGKVGFTPSQPPGKRFVPPTALSVRRGGRTRQGPARIGDGFVTSISRVGRYRSYTPVFNAARERDHSSRVNVSVGPAGSFESRTWTASWSIATATQAPLPQAVLFRHSSWPFAFDIRSPPSIRSPNS